MGSSATSCKKEQSSKPPVLDGCTAGQADARHELIDVGLSPAETRERSLEAAAPGF